MRRPIHALLLLLLCLPLAGCGGCGGGGISEAELRRRAIQRPKDEEAPAPTIAKAAKKGRPNVADSGKVSPTSPPAATLPVAAAAGPETASAPAPSNEKPAGPLTETERRARSIANLEKIGQSLAAYSTKWGPLPPGGIPRDGELLLSWRVVILPELGYPDLYKRFKPNEPWDSPHNKALLDYIPAEYQSPERFDAKTNYLGVAGMGMAIATGSLESLKSGVRLGSMRDGADNTLMVVEVDDKYAQEWTRPVDHVPQLELPGERLGSLRGEGAFGILVSGRVVLLPRELPPSRLAALFTVAGGEPIGGAASLPAPAAEPPPPRLETLADSPEVANQPLPAEAVDGGQHPADSATGESSPAADGPPLLAGSVPYVPDAAKEPIPDEQSLAKARELLKELYGESHRLARTAQEQREFLMTLVDDISSVEGSPADFYELARIVRDLAAAYGELPQALAACERLEQRFQVDPLPMRLHVLETIGKNAKAGGSLEPLLAEARRIKGEAERTDRYEIALPAHELLVSLARIGGDRAELARLQQQADALAAARSLHASAQRSLAVLQKNPDDAAANEAVGVYLCLVKSRWDAGLPYLARAEDIRLRGIASLELAAGRSTGETLSLAQQHWDLAARFKLPQRRGLHLRAVYCYGLVLAKLATGLESVKAQRRIDEAAALYGQEEISRILTPLGLPNATKRTGNLSSR